MESNSKRIGAGSKEKYQDDAEYDRYHKKLISDKVYNEKYDLTKAAHP